LNPAANFFPKALANPTDCDGIPVIKVETSNSNSSVGSKCQHKDLIELLLSKKPREQLAKKSVIPPAQPQTKKTGTKVTKVGMLSYPHIY